MAQTAKLGEWISPITTDMIVAKTLSLSESRLVGLSGGRITWIEVRSPHADPGARVDGLIVSLGDAHVTDCRRDVPRKADEGAAPQE